MTATTDTVRLIPATEHERLARMILTTLDAQQAYFKGRSGPDSRRLLSEAKDHERRLRQVAEAALVAGTRTTGSLFDGDDQ